MSAEQQVAASTTPRRVQHFHSNNNNTPKKKPVKVYKEVTQQPQQQPTPSATNNLIEEGKPPDNVVVVEIPFPQQQDQVDCLICCEPIQVHAVYQNCEHNTVCWKCCLSLREHMKDLACCMCKVKSDYVILTADSMTKQFKDFDTKFLFYDATFKAYTDNKAVLLAMDDLRALRCRICNDTHRYANMHQLKNHLQNAHNKMNYCTYCLESRTVFLSEQKLYTWAQLNKHYRVGEKDEKNGLIRGHPYCKFCKKRFYADELLFSHMSKDHFECFLCKQQGIFYHYYSDYNHLEQHFDEQHHLCRHKICMELKYVVFSNELDLRAHELKEHAIKTGKKANQAMTLNLFGSTSSPTSPDNSIAAAQLAQARSRRIDDLTAAAIVFVGQASDVFDPEHKAETTTTTTTNTDSKKNKKQRGFKDKFGETKEFSYQTDDGPSSFSEEQKQKNSELVKKMKLYLAQPQYEEFKKVSGDFQRGNLLATEYYKIMVRFFGDKANEIYQDLVASMPEKDKKKKDALSLAHSMHNSKEFGVSDEPPAPEPVVLHVAPKKKPQQRPKTAPAKPKPAPANNTPSDGWPSLQAMQAAPTAAWGAVVVNKEGVKKKTPQFAETDFPTLGNTSAPASNNMGTAWGKGNPVAPKPRRR